MVEKMVGLERTLYETNCLDPFQSRLKYVMKDKSQELRGGGVPLIFLLDLLMVYDHGNLLHQLKGISVLFYNVSALAYVDISSDC